MNQRGTELLTNAQIYTYNQHVADLARSMEVTVEYLPNYVSAVYSSARLTPYLGARIRIRAVTSALRYVIALHELGHVADNGLTLFNNPHFMLNDGPGATLAIERRAWSWARSVALDWPDVARRAEKAALSTYEIWRIKQRRRLV